MQVAQATALMQDVRSIATASYMYRTITGRPPRGTVSGKGSAEEWNEDSRKLFVEFKADYGSNPATEAAWGGPYLDHWPEETPLGGIYAYRFYETDNTWSRNNLENLEGEAPPSDRDFEVVMIRFNHVSDDSTRKEMRQEAQEALQRVIPNNRIYIVPNPSNQHNSGWLGVEIVR